MCVASRAPFPRQISQVSCSVVCVSRRSIRVKGRETKNKRFLSSGAGKVLMFRGKVLCLMGFAAPTHSSSCKVGLSEVVGEKKTYARGKFA